MYKYQIETIYHIINTCNLLEEKTEDRKSLRIGYMRYKYWNGNGWGEHKGELRIQLNSEYRFRLCIHNTSLYKEFDIIDEDDYIKIDSKVFLNLNKFIEEIYKEKQEIKKFHERLNKELEVLNKSLE